MAAAEVAGRTPVCDPLAARGGLDAAYIPAVEAGETDVRWQMAMTLLRALDVSHVIS